MFVVVLHRRMGRVVAAEKDFSDAHSRATGVIADTIANLTTVRSQAAEDREKGHVGTLVGDSLSADLRARRVFTTTRLQMESAMALFNWAAVAVGVVLALHHVAAAGVVYLILFYATFVGTSLEESFEFIRLMSRAIGRCAKFAGIAATRPDIVDVPGAPDLAVPHGRRGLPRACGSPTGPAPRCSTGWTCASSPGEHVGLVGPSGSGKTTLTKLMLRFADRDGGLIEIDGQDIARVTQQSLRRHIAYVPQDPQMLHRTIAENICYGLGARAAASTWTWCGPSAAPPTWTSSCERLPDGYETVVGERGLKLSGGQRQRVAIAQAMAKGAKVLVLDEATSALDSESESLVQEALWHLMEGTTALVVAHRLATIARLDRIVVLDRGRVVEQGTHAELLSAGAGRCLRPAVGPPVRRLPGRLIAGGRRGHAGHAVAAGCGRRRRRCAAGRKTRNVVDHPGVSTMSTKPSCASATDLAMARPRPVPGHAHLGRGGEPVEALEELVALALGDAGSLVEHLHPGVGVDAVHDHVDPPPAGRELDGIGQQVAQQLVEAGGVAEDRHLVAGLHGQRDPGHGGRRLDGVHRLVGQAVAGPAR